MARNHHLSRASGVGLGGEWHERAARDCYKPDGFGFGPELCIHICIYIYVSREQKEEKQKQTLAKHQYEASTVEILRALHILATSKPTECIWAVRAL